MVSLLPDRIALSGPIGSGKTELRKYLVEHQGYTAMSFAYPLRADIAKYFGIPINDLIESPAKEAYRWMLVMWGTDLARRFDQDWWVKRFKVFYEHELNCKPGKKLVVDDLRFMNEHETLQSLGFDIVRLQPSYLRTWGYLTDIRGYTEAEANKALAHESETALKEVEWENVVFHPDTLDKTVAGLFDLYRKKRGLAA